MSVDDDRVLVHPTHSCRVITLIIVQPTNYMSPQAISPQGPTVNDPIMGPFITAQRGPTHQWDVESISRLGLGVKFRLTEQTVLMEPSVGRFLKYSCNEEVGSPERTMMWG